LKFDTAKGDLKVWFFPHFRCLETILIQASKSTNAKIIANFHWMFV
jgi:hypothetical protein